MATAGTTGTTGNDPAAAPEGAAALVPAPPQPLPGAERDADDRRDLEARQLMLQAQRGDREAFAKLFDSWHRQLFGFFWRLCHDRTVAEDLVQETFLRLWRAAGRYHCSGRFTTYLFQIAKNLWLNEREKLQRRAHASLDAGQTDSDGALSPLRDRLADASVDDPSDRAVSSEAARLAREAVESLDEKHRLVLVLAHFHNLRYREIAAILEIPEGTVKTRMMNAERKLRDKLASRLGPPP